MSSFQIIQGGMGVGVSGWALARTVSRLGQLGVVSGTGLASVLTRRLEAGDPGGHMRRALDHFPIPQIARRAVERYYIEGGKPADEPYKLAPLPNLHLSRRLEELIVLGNFAEVYLAKEGHGGLVGINYLEKIQTPTLASLFGAMLAGVDYILVGAGIPRLIPGALDLLACGKPAELRIDVEGAAPGEAFFSRFDPGSYGHEMARIHRPKFLAIIASATLGMTLARKSNGRVDGFIVEGPTAGGHNAPPRGALQLNERGEPVYGERDVVELDKLRALELPFWLAGGYADEQGLGRALAQGASGIQVGTAFAFCDESGITAELKRSVIENSIAGRIRIFTDPVASPTGFPFKVVELPGTLSETEVYRERRRDCDLGYLRRLYRKEDGSVGYRCPAEPPERFVSKGGQSQETDGRKCLCNALFSNIGLGQNRRGETPEPPLLTAGDDVSHLERYLQPGRLNYGAADVIRVLLGGVGLTA